MLSSLRRWPRTVRGRVTLAAVLAAGVLMLAAGVLAHEVQERSLRDRLERNLTTRAADIAALVEAGQLPARLSGGGEHSGAQVINASGRVVATTPNTRDAPFSPQRPDVGEVVATETRGALEEGHSGLVVALGVAASDGRYTVLAAEDLEEIDDSLSVLRRTLIIGLPLLLLAVGVITALSVGRALRPVERARRQLAAIGASSLDKRISVPATEDEISRLSTTMNQLLERLEDGYRREQRFIADASHELRSPVATLRSNLELAGSNELDPSEIRGEVLRLENLVDDLLHLARRDGAEPSPTLLVDVDDIVLEEVSRAAITEVKIDAGAVSAAQLRGVPGDLTRLVRNLLDNAVRHARRQVHVSLGERDDHVEFVVDDDGPGIPAEERHNVFERFGRVESDRGRKSGSTGLGLAIVRAIVDSHGGSIEISDAPLGGARCVVRLPSAAGLTERPAPEGRV